MAEHWNDSEEWRPIPDWEGLYEVSDLGIVRSVDRIVVRNDGTTRKYPGVILKQKIDRRRGKHDRRSVGLSRQGRTQWTTAGRLVLRAFVGPCPEGMECCHANDVQADNRLVNLRWDTHENNILDSLRNGGRCRGERHLHAKMTAGKVRMVRAMRCSGKYAVNELAKIFGVSWPAMTNILERRAWKHV